MPRTDGLSQPFQGFGSPTYTQVPDEVFDVLAPDLTEAELRVLLYLVRRTFGFKKNSDDISLKQLVEGIKTQDGRVLDRGAGVSKSTAVRAVKGLIEQGVITATRNRSSEKGDEPTTYRLRFKADPVFYGETRGGSAIEHPRVLPQNPQQTDGQQTGFNPSNFERSHDDLEHTDEDAGDGDDHLHALTEPQRADPPPETETRYVPLGEAIRLRQQAVATIGAGRAAVPTDIESQPAPPPPSTPPSRQRGRPALGTEEERDKLYAFLKDFCPELGDEAQLASSITQVLKIFRRAGLPIQRWDDALYAARRTTQEHSGSITKERSDDSSGFRRKNKFPYFKAVLEQQVGLRPEPAVPSSRNEHAG